MMLLANVVRTPLVVSFFPCRGSWRRYTAGTALRMALADAAAA
ncbi:MAG: hypothetical protein AVDCRST_MAG18-3228, partial [uncultured Thermomicrobiales bacterium]